MSKDNEIIIKGLTQNNLKHISLTIPKEKIVVFTGVSGSGKSSIVFDTIAAESQRQMNETYSAFIRGRLPKYEKPAVELIDNLTASVIIDQSRLGGNVRSTVGTISDMYSALRLLFSRIGSPYVGTASYFSFNDPNGMCKKCSGIGKVTEINMDLLLIEDKSWNEGMVNASLFNPGNWYWEQYANSGLFDNNKKLKDYSEKERNLLLYGAYEKGGEKVNKHVEGLYNQFTRLYLKRDLSVMSDSTNKRSAEIVMQKICPECHGKRLSKEALGCYINGYTIADMCEMEFVSLREVLSQITDPRAQTMVHSLCESINQND